MESVKYEKSNIVKSVYPEGTESTYGQKFVMRNGTWVAIGSSWMRITGNKTGTTKATKIKQAKQKKLEIQTKAQQSTNVVTLKKGGF